MKRKNSQQEIYNLLDKIWEEKDFFEEDKKILIVAEEYEDLKKFKERHEDYVRDLEESIKKSYLRTKISRNVLKEYKKIFEKYSEYIYESIYDKEQQDGTIQLKKQISKEHHSLLEKIINENEKNNPNNYSYQEKYLLYNYYHTKQDEYLNKFLESTENKAVKEIDYLGPGVLGMYIPSTDTIYVVRSLTGPIRDFVIAHKKAHRRRAYSGENQNEEAVDAEARASTGIPVYR